MVVSFALTPVNNSSSVFAAFFWKDTTARVFTAQKSCIWQSAVVNDKEFIRAFDTSVAFSDGILCETPSCLIFWDSRVGGKSYLALKWCQMSAEISERILTGNFVREN